MLSRIKNAVARKIFGQNKNEEKKYLLADVENGLIPPKTKFSKDSAESNLAQSSADIVYLLREPSSKKLCSETLLAETNASALSILPPEIILAITDFLDWRSLGQLVCVDKTCRDLIYSSRFKVREMPESNEIDNETRISSGEKPEFRNYLYGEIVDEFKKLPSKEACEKQLAPLKREQIRLDKETKRKACLNKNKSGLCAGLLLFSGGAGAGFGIIAANKIFPLDHLLLTAILGTGGCVAGMACQTLCYLWILSDYFSHESYVVGVENGKKCQDLENQMSTISEDRNNFLSRLSASR